MDRLDAFSIVIISTVMLIFLLIFLKYLLNISDFYVYLIASLMLRFYENILK